MRSGMTREQQKKLLLAEGALQRFECVQARRAMANELGSLALGGPTGVLRAVSGRGWLSLAATALPLVLGAGRVARMLKRGMLVVGGIAAALSAISRWREQSVKDDGAKAPGLAAGHADSTRGTTADAGK
ncbi:MAG: hypothetical protein RL404_719 [Pseudomonadota bacterium]